MRILAEMPRVSANGDFYVFRVIRHVDGAVCCRLSCPDRQQATEWVQALAAVCAFHQSQRHLGYHSAASNSQAALASATIDQPVMASVPEVSPDMNLPITDNTFVHMQRSS